MPLDNEALKYRCLPFDELSRDEFYDLAVLRQEVFIVEQNCPYLDLDGKDKISYHVVGYHPSEILLAYARLVPPGISYPDYASIGRVIIHQTTRGRREGLRLMEYNIKETKHRWPDFNIKISAQTHLQDFYGLLGFTAVGEPYLEDDIPHIAMVLAK